MFMNGYCFKILFTLAKGFFMKQIGECMGFTGGDEDTPVAEIVSGRKNPRKRRVKITQNDQAIYLSLDTLRSILLWGTSAH